MFKRFFRKNDERPLLIAHRGARRLAPENTLAAFEKAIKLGFDGIELDVVMTKDKVPVVFHGNELAHATRESGRISDYLSYDLEKIDAGSLFDPIFKGEKIPTLSDALKLISGSSLFLNIELKSQPRGCGGMEEVVAEMIYYYKMTDRVLVSSFSPLILRKFSRIAPKIPTALLVGPHPFLFLKTFLSANMLNVSAINPILQDTTPMLVNFVRKRGWKIFVWTINTRQEFKRALELKVDGIITDEHELLKIR